MLAEYGTGRLAAYTWGEPADGQSDPRGDERSCPPSSDNAVSPGHGHIHSRAIGDNTGLAPHVN